MASHFRFKPGERFWIVQTGWSIVPFNRGNWHIYLSPKGVNDIMRGQTKVTVYTVDTEIDRPAQITPIFVGYAVDFPELDKKGNLNKPCESTSNLTSPSVATEKLVTP